MSRFCGHHQIVPRPLEGPLLTHQFSNGTEKKPTNFIYICCNHSPSSVQAILTRHLLSFTFAPHDSTQFASTSVLLCFWIVPRTKITYAGRPSVLKSAYCVKKPAINVCVLSCNPMFLLHCTQYLQSTTQLQLLLS